MMDRIYYFVCFSSSLFKLLLVDKAPDQCRFLSSACILSIAFAWALASMACLMVDGSGGGGKVSLGNVSVISKGGGGSDGNIVSGKGGVSVRGGGGGR
jgi:hypothetical protein